MGPRDRGQPALEPSPLQANNLMMALPAFVVTAATQEAWHSLPRDAVVHRIGSDPLSGLTEAEAKRRLAAFGPNVIKAVESESLWGVFLDLIREPLMLLLLGIGVLYSIWGELRDALTIVGIVVLMVAAEVFNDYRASRTIAGLSKIAEPTTRVLREGRAEEVVASTVVPGDVLVLSAGRRVPADARLVGAFGLAIDESMLTGESVPVDKDPNAMLAATASLADRANMVYAGTLPTRGRGTVIVVETGGQTELGRIAKATAEVEEPQTPLQKSIRELSGWMVWPALGVSVLVPLLGIVLTHQPLERMILTGLSLVFAMIPEELPLIITMILAVGCYRLAKRGALIKRMAAAETLGDVSVIVTDKTGTLTEGCLSLSDVEPTPARSHVVQLGALTIPAESTAADVPTDPFDLAFFDAAKLEGNDVSRLSHDSQLVNEFPFENIRKRMSVVRRAGEGYLVIVRGAPESVLAQCDLDEDAKRKIRARVDEIAGKGLRLLALAEKTAASNPADVNQAESALTFVGMAAFLDPPRAEVASAIDACLRAGIQVLMVTGDHPDTAKAIAGKVGIPAREVIIGPELDRMTDDKLAEALSRSPVMARCTPVHKQRIVRVLESRGELVAVTGDGINDAPALALAHVGVAMGKRGTDVAREAADVILADDNFASVEHAVEEGRVIHANLRKGVRFYLAFKLALTGATLIPVLLLLPVAFAPIQIILTELFMDLGASASFVAEPPEAGLMTGRAHDPRSRFMDHSMLISIAGAAIGLSSAVILSYTLAWHAGLGAATAQTMAFATLLLGTALMAVNLRSEKEPLLKLGVTSNIPLLVWSIAIIAFVLVAVLVPPAHALFKTVALSGSQWALVLVLAVAGTMWIEAVKVLRTRMGNTGLRVSGKPQEPSAAHSLP
jgi:P-type Ca2+ transporter type 2C